MPNVDMWVCAPGARHSKSLERRCPRTASLRRGPKIIYSYYTRCALIRDRQPTAWDDFARPAEVEDVYQESKSSDSSREIPYYKCQVRGSFCEITEEYDVKITLL